MKAELVKEGVFWVGVQNPDLRNFDMMMRTPQGTSYNSYLIRGKEKTALVDVVKDRYSDEQLARISEICDAEEIDYLILTRTEPDHVATIKKLLEICPKMVLVTTKVGFDLLEQMANERISGMQIKDDDTIPLGGKTLRIISTPRLHWPDCLLISLEEDNILFSGDVFGAHYSGEEVFAEKILDNNELLKQQKIYFEKIFGAHIRQILILLEKMSDCSIHEIAPAHGPVLRKGSKALEAYRQWALDVLPDQKDKKILVGYFSCYGYTKEIAATIYKTCIQANYKTEALDFSTVSVEEAIQKIYQADALALGTPTLNGDLIRPMWEILSSLAVGMLRDKNAVCFGSYGWSGEGIRYLAARLKDLGCTVLNTLAVKLKPGEEEFVQARNLAIELMDSID